MSDRLSIDLSQSGQLQLPFLLNLDGYEGPIDMLLSLAREQKVDLSRIAVLPLAEQYLTFIEKAQKLDLEIAADYLVMAAWLTFLKSRLIIPNSNQEEVDNLIDMTDALKFQLKRLEAMQSASKRLMQLPKLHKSRLIRGMPDDFPISDKITFTANLYDLLKVYGDIRSAKNNNTLTYKVTKLYTVQEAIERLRKLIPSIPEWLDLIQFLPPKGRKEQHYSSVVASHFGAVLELVKEGSVSIKQDSKFSPILLRAKREIND